MDQFFSLLNSLWSSAPIFSFARHNFLFDLTLTLHSRCIEVLIAIGQKLYANRSPFYNLLRTHFGLSGFPLELDLFAAKPAEKKDIVIVGGEELPFQFSDYSSNVSVDQKKHSVKFSKIQRSGNWVILDLSVPSLLTDININFQTVHNSISGQLSIDCYLERETDGSRVATQKIEPLRKKKKQEKKDSYSFHEISKLCRYIKIDIKSFTPSGETGSMTVDLYGILDFITPSTQSLGKPSISIQILISIRILA